MPASPAHGKVDSANQTIRHRQSLGHTWNESQNQIFDAIRCRLLLLKEIEEKARTANRNKSIVIIAGNNRYHTLLILSLIEQHTPHWKGWKCGCERVNVKYAAIWVRGSMIWVKSVLVSVGIRISIHSLKHVLVERGARCVRIPEHVDLTFLFESKYINVCISRNNGAQHRCLSLWKNACTIHVWVMRCWCYVCGGYVPCAVYVPCGCGGAQHTQPRICKNVSICICCEWIHVAHLCGRVYCVALYTVQCTHICVSCFICSMLVILIMYA